MSIDPSRERAGLSLVIDQAMAHADKIGLEVHCIVMVAAGQTCILDAASNQAHADAIALQLIEAARKVSSSPIPQADQ